MFATLCWSGNFIVGKFAYLFEVPPLTLNFLRWVSVWIILIPFTYKEIFNNFNYIKKNWMVISFMGVITISTFNSVVYFALNLYPSNKRSISSCCNSSYNDNYFILNESR